MLRDITEKETLLRADNLMDVVQYLSDTRPSWRQSSSKVKSGHGSDWDLGASYEESLRLARDGWDDGVRKLQSLISQVPTKLTPVAHYGVEGDHPDVGRYVSGHPYNMVRRVKERVPRGVVAIACNMVASASISANSIANFGAAICVLADRLENKMIRCELIGTIAIDRMGCDHKLTLAWQIKNPEDPLDLAAAAFSFGHPAMLRRLCFGVLERTPARYETDGYGSCGQATAESILQCPRDALVINGVGHNPGRCSTITAALEYAKDQINAAAVAAGGEPIAELEEV